MEIKFFFGNITGRGEEVGIRFSFDESLIDQIKTTLNKHRYRFKMQTDREPWQAGGWFQDKKLWYIALEIWLPFKEDLTALGHQFVQMSEYESSKYSKSEPKSEAKSETNSNSKSNSNWHWQSQSNQSGSDTKEQAKEEPKNNQSQSKEDKKENTNKSRNQKRKTTNKNESNNSSGSKSKSSNNKRNQYNKPPTKGNFLEKEYEILGVSISVSRSELKQAYRDLVEVWHPDRFTHNERLRRKAEEMLKRINSAYDRIKAVA